MKIGIDIRNIGKKRTGDEMVFFNLVKNLAEIDSVNNYKLFTDINDVELLVNIKKRLGIEDKDSFEIVSLGSGNKFVWNFWTLPNYLRKNPVDVYHTQYITPFFVSRKIKVVTTIHDISFNFYPRFIKFTDLFFLKILIPLSLQRADKIIGVSKFTRDEIVKYYKIDPGKVDFIYNAVGSEFLNEDFSRERLESVKRKYDLPGKFIFYIGTLQPRKNIPALIKSYSKIKDRLGDIKLVLAGNKKARNADKKINKVIEKLGIKGDVVFTGYINQKDSAAVYKLASVFCLPSLYEGFGIPVLEAMSQGTPVVVSDIPSLREIAGDAALYFNPLEFDNLENKLYNICRNEELRNKLINLGSRQIGLFSWKKTAEKTLGIYNSLT